MSTSVCTLHVATPLKRAMVFVFIYLFVFIMMVSMFLSTLTPNHSSVNTAVTFSLSVRSEFKDYT